MKSSSLRYSVKTNPPCQVSRFSASSADGSGSAGGFVEFLSILRCLFCSCFSFRSNSFLRFLNEKCDFAIGSPHRTLCLIVMRRKKLFQIKRRASLPWSKNARSQKTQDGSLFFNISGKQGSIVKEHFRSWFRVTI